MRVRFDRGAFADLAEILDYVAERNPDAAAALSARFDEAAELLTTMADLGLKTSRNDFRRLVIGNYVLVYEIAKGEIIIRYVRHGARKRPWEGED